jgi:HK97 gp10 family phage protein
MTDVKLTGFKELEAALEELTKAAGKGVLRRAGKTVLQQIADAAQGMAPRAPGPGGGTLAESIAVSTVLSKQQKAQHRKTVKDDKSSVEVFVGAGPDPAAHNQEFGNANHGAQPFMRPAWDAGKAKVLDDLKDELWTEIDKAAARAARKAAKAGG